MSSPRPLHGHHHAAGGAAAGHHHGHQIPSPHVGPGSRTTFQDLKTFLSAQPLQTIIKKQQASADTTEIITVLADSTVLTTMKMLVEHDIRSVPVRYPDGSYKFLDYIDVLAFAMNVLQSGLPSGADISDERLSDPDVIRGFLQASAGEVANFSGRNPFTPHRDSETVLEAASDLSRVKRVPVFDTHDRLVAILTATDVINLVVEQCEDVIVASALRVSDFLTVRDVVTAREEERAIKAFQLMSSKGLSALPVLDEDGEMSSVLSIRDFKYVAMREDFELLKSTVFDMVIHGKEGQLRGDTGKTQFPYITCKMDSTLADVLRKLVATRVHRLVVSDGNKHSIGVISLTDLVNRICA